MKRTLKEWQEHYHTTEEYQQLFYTMDLTMKTLHQYNYQITNFNPTNITVGTNENEQTYIMYQQVAPLNSNQSLTDIHQNMYNFAFLQVGIYSNTLDYLTPTFLKDNFDRFTIFLPQDDVSYFRKLLVQKGHFYYSDYKNAQNEQKLAVLNKEMAEDTAQGKAQHRAQTKTKATAAGKLYGLPDEKEGMGAFVQYYLLPFLIFSLSLLIPLIAWLFALS